MPQPAIIVHGGAGLRRHPDTRPWEEGCARAAARGWEVLAAGGSALDAVIAAVVALEDDPLFNAGTGSVLNEDGEIETDAALMEGTHLRAGAVAALKGVKNPILLARAVMEKSGHLLLVGEGAARFAREVGIPVGDWRALVTPAAEQRWLETMRERSARGAAPPGADSTAVHDWAGGGAAWQPAVERKGRGTVGACALDARGHVACATSTGGTSYKRAGRVGDTPLIACGSYADDGAGAVSCTGHGEAIIRVAMAHACAERMRRGLSAQEAANEAVRELGARVQGEGGLICVDREGRVGFAHNTEAMSRAYIVDGAPVVAGA